MKGVSTKARLNVSSARATLGEVVAEVNRLPFAHVGFSASFAAAWSPGQSNAWVPIPFSSVLVDSDEMLAGGTSATIPEGCEGVYVVGIGVSTISNAMDVRVRRNGSENLILTSASMTPVYAQTPPIVLRVNDRLTWEANTSNALWSLRGRNDTGSSTFPHLSIHRVGLLP